MIRSTRLGSHKWNVRSVYAPKDEFRSAEVIVSVTVFGRYYYVRLGGRNVAR